MDRCELLQTSHLPEAQHCMFTSLKRQVRVHGPAVHLTTSFLLGGIADDFHHSTVRPQFISHVDLWFAKARHCFSKEFQCCLAITALSDIDLPAPRLRGQRHTRAYCTSPSIFTKTSSKCHSHSNEPKFLNPFSSDLCGEQWVEFSFSDGMKPHLPLQDDFFCKRPLPSPMYFV